MQPRSRARQSFTPSEDDIQKMCEEQQMVPTFRLPPSASMTFSDEAIIKMLSSAQSGISYPNLPFQLVASEDFT